jgi:hypothetical protein
MRRKKQLLRRRPVRDPTPLWLHAALERYLDAKGCVGVVYREAWNHIKMTFGRGHTFYVLNAKLRTYGDMKQLDDRLYDRATRTLDRRLRKLGWV